MADYLERYAAHFALPVRCNTRVERLSRDGSRYRVETSHGQIEADQVVVAMAGYQGPRIPAFAPELRDDIVQLHSSQYRNPAQLREGGVLLVGAGNSGAELAREITKTHPVWLAGRYPGRIPFRIAGFWGRLVLVRLTVQVVFHLLLTVRTPVGRKARKKFLHGAGPLIRVQPQDLAALGVRRAPRVVGARDGLPLLADGRTLDVANVIYCTGYDPERSWIDLPVFDELGDPRHRSGIVPTQPGLYFVGLHFLHALSSAMIHGVGRDAVRIARAVAARARG
jgi:putative flavoprotein involved in K+ transport